MNDIGGINGYVRSNSIRPIQSGQAHQPNQPATAQGNKEDKVEISRIALYLQRISELPDIRQGKVAGIRQVLAEGRYDIDEKLSIALDRLLEEYGPE